MNQANNNNNHSNEPPKENPLELLGKKRIYFIVKKVNKNVMSLSSKKYEKYNINEGRWSYIEKKNFIKALSIYGVNFKEIKEIVGSRTLAQIRSHAQKLFKKLKKCKNKQLGIDFTTESIKTFKDIINHIKSVNNNYDINNILLRLTNKRNNIGQLNVDDFLIKNETNISKTNYEKFMQDNNNYDLNQIYSMLNINSFNNIINNTNKLFLNYLSKSVLETNLFNRFNFNYLHNISKAQLDFEQSFIINNTKRNIFNNTNIE